MSTDQAPAEVPKHEAETAANPHPDLTPGHTAAAPPVVPSETTEVQQGLEPAPAMEPDAAELANRSVHAVAAPGDALKDADTALKLLLVQQNKRALLLFSMTGALFTLGTLVFGTMTINLKSRLHHLDAMLVSMSQRVGELNASLEVVASVNESLQEMVSKQAGIATSQVKLEARINEMMASTQNMPALAAKQIDEKGQTLARQVQSMDGRLQALAGQMQGLRAALGETGGLKREMEALARMQRERQQAEANSQAQASQAKAAAEAAALAASRQREKMVQYPRVGESSPTPGAGVLSTK